MNPRQILVIIALALTICALFVTKWPLVTVAVLLLCVANLIG